jgi:hypothetical protein
MCVHVCLAAHLLLAVLSLIGCPVVVNRGALQKDEGQALAVCKFDTLDAQAYKQYGYAAHEDSDGSDGYSVDSDSDNEEVWRRRVVRACASSCLPVLLLARKRHTGTHMHAYEHARRRTHVPTPLCCAFLSRDECLSPPSCTPI